MLRIRIEVVSGGKARTIASIRSLEHANAQTGSEMWSETGFIDDHDRMSAPVWRLAERAAKWCADAIDNRYRPSMRP